MRLITGMALAMLACAVSAQTCDVKWTVISTIDGKVKLKNTREVFDLSTDDVKKAQARGQRMLDAASQVQDKGGPVTLTFGEWVTCDGKAIPGPGGINEVEVRGLTLKAANQVGRVGGDGDRQMHDEIDKRHGQGKKQPWGKD